MSHECPTNVPRMSNECWNLIKVAPQRKNRFIRVWTELERFTLVARKLILRCLLNTDCLCWFIPKTGKSTQTEAAEEFWEMRRRGGGIWTTLVLKFRQFQVLIWWILSVFTCLFTARTFKEPQSCRESSESLHDDEGGNQTCSWQIPETTERGSLIWLRQQMQGLGCKCFHSVDHTLINKVWQKSEIKNSKQEFRCSSK